MARNSLCICGSGKKTKKCHRDLHSESKVAITLQKYNELEKIISEYREIHSVNSPCKNGCSDCCYDKFYISNVEFEIILYYIKENWSKEEIENIYDKSIENLELLKNKNNNLYQILEGDGNVDSSIYFKQILSGSERLFPCVLLDENTQSCRVYKVRPLVCRTHGTTHDSNHLNKDVPICEFIPSTIRNAKITPDVSEYISVLDRNFHMQVNNKYIRMREYPIFYWFVLYYRKTEGRKNAQLLEETYYFKLPKETGDSEQIKKYRMTRLF